MSVLKNSHNYPLGSRDYACGGYLKYRSSAKKDPVKQELAMIAGEQMKTKNGILRNLST